MGREGEGLSDTLVSDGVRRVDDVVPAVVRQDDVALDGCRCDGGRVGAIFSAGRGVGSSDFGSARFGCWGFLGEMANVRSSLQRDIISATLHASPAALRPACHPSLHVP